MIAFALVTIGITYGITASALLRPLRGLLVWASGGSSWVAVLLYCPACMGFWVGALLGAAGLWPEAVHGFSAAWRSAFAAAALGALWSEYGPPSPFEHEQPQFFGELAHDQPDKPPQSPS